MAVSVRIGSIARDLDLMVNATLSPEAQGRMFAEFAMGERDKALVQNRAALGRATGYSVAVNGRAGASEMSATVPGVIAYEFDVGSDVLAAIGDMLVQASPVLTGLYARSFAMFVGGVEYQPGDAIPATDEEIVFLNLQSYARKIERGLSDQAPDGVFQAVAVMAQRRFGNMASIRFSYRSLGGKARAKKSDSGDRMPAIIVSLR